MAFLQLFFVNAEVCGVGLRVVLQRDGATTRLVIKDLEAGGSASRAIPPLHAGDFLTHIDGVPWPPPPQATFCTAECARPGSGFRADAAGLAPAFLARLLGPPGSEASWPIYTLHSEDEGNPRIRHAPPCHAMPCMPVSPKILGQKLLVAHATMPHDTRAYAHARSIPPKGRRGRSSLPSYPAAL